MNPTNPSILRGLRVLLVEDEPLVAMLMEQILEDLGCVLMGPADSVEDALALLEAGPAPDVAVLDVNLGGVKSFPVAEALANHKVPFAFSTGYGEVGIPEDWRHQPSLRKPYGYEDVVKGLTRLAQQATA